MNDNGGLRGGFVVAGLVAAASVAWAANAAEDRPLERPKDLRELVFLTSGLDMAYGPAREAAGASPPFTNVYVTREGYQGFMRTGVWPEGTTFFLEVRRSESGVSIAAATGRSQGELLAVEAAMKDTKRNPDGGWVYFDLGRKSSASAEPRSASCYSCHSRHGAVEWTFTQFYPEQFAVAKQKGTVRKDYDPAAKAE